PTTFFPHQTFSYVLGSTPVISSRSSSSTNTRICSLDGTVAKIFPRTRKEDTSKCGCSVTSGNESAIRRTSPIFISMPYNAPRARRSRRRAAPGEEEADRPVELARGHDTIVQRFPARDFVGAEEISTGSGARPAAQPQHVIDRVRILDHQPALL